MKKRGILIIAIIVAIMNFSIRATNDEIVPMRDYGRCYDSYGNPYTCHSMQARGRGDAYVYNRDGSRTRVIVNGQASQCKRCKYLLISQYNPFDWSEYELGTYCAKPVDYWIGNVITSLTFESYEQHYSNTIPEEFCFEK